VTLHAVFSGKEVKYILANERSGRPRFQITTLRNIFIVGKKIKIATRWWYKIIFELLFVQYRVNTIIQCYESRWSNNQRLDK